MYRAPPPEARAKVASIQALRAIAAITVAVIHLAGGFASHIDSRLAWLPPGDQLAQTAVALFFVISGCVMVLSSDRLFGSRRGVPVFWWRRAARVLPPYWIATGLLAAVAVALGQTIEFGEVARSLAFIGTPSANISGAPFELFLWPGWSLFYELLFYALFGTFVALGRVLAVTATSAVLVLLVLAGTQVSPDFLPAYAATRPIVLLFVIGMVFGLALEGGGRAPSWLRWSAAATAVAAFVLVQSPAAPLDLGYLAWAGLPAALIFFAVVNGPSSMPMPRWAGSLGDASYAIYLLHVPFAHLWMRVFNGWWNHPGGSIGFLVLGVPLLIALSLAFYRWVERPLTDRLHRTIGDGPNRRGLVRTLAP